MIIDLKSLRNSGKEEESFYFDYVPENHLSDIPNVDVTSVKVNGTVYLEGKHSAYIEGEINYSLSGDCTRCLVPTTREYVIEFAENADNEDETGYPVLNDKVDLKKIVEDAIMTNLPVSFLCKEDCKGLCTECGANLNEGEHKCKIKEGN